MRGNLSDRKIGVAPSWLPAIGLRQQRCAGRTISTARLGTPTPAARGAPLCWRPVASWCQLLALASLLVLVSMVALTTVTARDGDRTAARSRSASHFYVTK
jgi:hypothetical protein